MRFPTPARSSIILPENLRNGWKINHPLLFLPKFIVPPGLQSLRLAQGPKSWREERQQNFISKAFCKHSEFTFKVNKPLKTKPVFWKSIQPPAP